MAIDIPINFCPKCKNKRIRVVQEKTFEAEYSLTGKCLHKSKSTDTTYTLLKCTKCGWKSSTWTERGLYENKEEYEELEKIYWEAQNEQ